MLSWPRLRTLIGSSSKVHSTRSNRHALLRIERLEDRLVPTADLLWVGSRSPELVLALNPPLDVNITQISGATFAAGHSLSGVEILYVDDTAGEDNAFARRTDIASFVSAGGVLITDNGGNPQPNPADSNFDWVPNAANIDVKSGADKDKVFRTSAGSNHSITDDYDSIGSDGTNAALSHWEDSMSTVFTKYVGMTPLTLGEDSTNGVTHAGVLVGTHGQGTLIYFGQHLAFSDPDFESGRSGIDDIRQTAAELLYNTIQFGINTIDDQPQATNDTAGTNEDVAFTINVLGNDTGLDDTPLQVTATDPAHGSVVVNASNQVVYTPDPNWNGTDTFQYTVTDADNDSATATVTVTVLPINDGAPVASPDSDSTLEDNAVTIDVLDNDANLLDIPLVLTPTDPAGGSVSVNASNQIVYTPDPNFNGTDTFQYTVTDLDGQSSTTTVTVTVTPVDDGPPVADPDTAGTLEDNAVTISVLGNDDNLVDTPLLVTATDPPHGSVSVNASNQVVYTPDLNYNGTDTFQYTVTDQDGQSSTATVTVTITPVDDVNPAAVNDTATTEKNTPVDIAVLANDNAGVDGPATISSFDLTTTQGGSVTLNLNGTLKYTPPSGYAGPDSFSYTMADTDGETANATVNITVLAVIADDDSGTTDEDTPLSSINVLANDDLGDTPATTFISAFDAASVEGGTVVQVGNTFTYTPPANFHGSDSFTYTLEDEDGNTDTATVTITVNPLADDGAPVANDDSDTTDEDVPVTIDVLTNDTLGDTPTGVSAATVSAQGGTVLNNGDGTFLYTPPANFHGTDSFSYTLTDFDGQTDTALVTITVVSVFDVGEPVIDLPEPRDQINKLGQQVSLPIPVTDSDNNLVSVTATGLPLGLGFVFAGGTLTISGQVDANAIQANNVPYTVTITATDADGLLAVETFTWTITRDAIGVFRARPGLWTLDSNYSKTANPEDDTQDAAALIAGRPRRFLPIAGDWDGDNVDTVGLYQRRGPGKGTWFRDINGDGDFLDTIDGDSETRTFAGLVSRRADRPVVGDWDGDGDDDLGIYRNGKWFLDRDGDFTFEAPGEKLRFKANALVQPVVGDWNGDGIDQIGLYFTETGRWLLDDGDFLKEPAALGDVRVRKYGGLGRRPVVGDWNGDGRDDVGFFRMKNKVWVVDVNGNAPQIKVVDQADRDARIFIYGVGGPVVGSWKPETL